MSPDQAAINRIKTEASPSFNAFYNHHPVTVTCDSGATSSLISQSFAIRAKLPISKTNQCASQADGKTKLQACGEVHITLARGPLKFKLEAMVVTELDCDILAGTPFMRDNDLVLDIPKSRIVVSNKHIISYKEKRILQTAPQVRRTQSFLLRAHEKSIVFPGDYVEIRAPHGVQEEIQIAVEPRCDSDTPSWPAPGLTSIVSGRIRIPNMTSTPISLRKNQHVAQICYIYEPTAIPESTMDSTAPKTDHPRPSPLLSPHSNEVIIDPDNQLSATDKKAFITLNTEYDGVFNPSFDKYNDASGRIRASINMGPVEPPPQKGRLPSYNRNNMEELQNKMDELEAMGVLAKPEDVGVTIEYVSPSFLVRKPNGGSRLVTSFLNIASYAKPPPSRVTTTDDIMRFLARWSFIIKSDMTSQFFQLPMTKASMKYLGVITPYKGTRVYTRAAMGMPGSTEHLNELMFRVLGELIHEGVVIKIADDLYIGGGSIESLLHNWERLLYSFQSNNLRLSAPKTVICPITTVVLGWVWSAGTISVSQHKLNPLTIVDKPPTVKGLRGWLGAVKHIKECIPRYSALLSDLETAVAGKESRDPVVWTESLSSTFLTAQAALKDPKTITTPRPSDLLIITHDGAVVNGGIGSVLYILRNGAMKLGGYYSAKLKRHQIRWLPCEVEALAISSAINHWGPYILESAHQTQILSDSRPCIQAFEKLSRGEFSSSSRVTTFLSTLSRYNVGLQHLSGSANIPADFLSRNPMECREKSCQVCSFISECQQAAIHAVTVSDVLEGKAPLPFANPTAWKVAQQDCPALRRTYSHLFQGTRPTKKMTNIKDVKRYLRVASMSNDGVLVVRQTTPFAPTKNLIIIPRQVLPGILTALHLRLQHPTKSQLQKLFQRQFYALDSEEAIRAVTANCHQCASLASFPPEVPQFSTSPTPTVLGRDFACDVMCRARQKIFVIRDSFSSFTMARIIANEQKESMRSAIIETTSDFKAPGGATIRADGATPLQSLVGDQTLQKLGLAIQIGRLKNPNKNPVAEKAVQELGMELKRQHPEGGPVSTSQLATAIAFLNSRVRNRGLSAKEILFQRDHTTGEQLNFEDSHLAQQQNNMRRMNHLPSARSKVPSGRKPTEYSFAPGDLVLLKGDGDKHKARDRYIVASVGREFVTAKKLVGSQFRSKDYQLTRSEIYPVPCASIQLPLSTGIKTNPYDSDTSEESDSDSVDRPAARTRLPDQSERGIEHTPAPLEACSNSSVRPNQSLPSSLGIGPTAQTEHPLQNAPAPLDGAPVVANPRSHAQSGSSRHKSVPVWMKSGDWDLK